MQEQLLIAAAQMAPNSEVIEENTERIVRLMSEAHKQGVRMICFPELALTPFFAVKNTREIEHYFVDASHPSLQMIRAKAKESRMNVILGYAEKTPIQYFNSALIFNHEGELVGNYRKMHLPGALIDDTVGNFEKIYFTPGDCDYPVFDLGIAKIGLQICYDRHFPEGYRSLALSGAQIIFNLTAASSYGTDWRGDTWDLLLRARAFENGVFVVGVNKAGIEYGKDYFGKSMIVSPLGGKIMAFADKGSEDQLVIGKIDLSELIEAKLRLPYARDRREVDDRFIQNPRKVGAGL